MADRTLGRDSRRFRPQIIFRHNYTAGTPKTAHSEDMDDFRPIRELILQTGAAACGVAKAEPVPDAQTESYSRWLEEGHQAGMAYMERYPDIRRDPRLLLEGAQSVISIAFSYRQPDGSHREGLPYVASYALGDDYHDVLRHRLQPVTEALKAMYGAESRICIDSAPIHERYWAVRCGIGERTASGAIYVPGAGTEVFLAEIITTQAFETAERPSNVIRQGCAGCGKCRQICPGKAIMADGGIDSRRCINYLTIEHRGDFTDEQRQILASTGSQTLFGCDRCLRVCPLNRHRPPTPLEEFRMRPLFQTLTAEEILTMAPTEFSRLFRGSPLKRAKLSGLQRNLNLGCGLSQKHGHVDR